jgi:hypothetical protein
MHPGFCGESNDDTQYPFTAGQLSNADRVFAGFDVGDSTFGLPMAALPGVDWHDVMTYCDRQWLSSYTYLGIRGRLVEEDALGSGAGAGSGRPDDRYPPGAPRAAQPPRRHRLVSIVAEINLTQRTGRIAYVQPIERGTLSTQDASSPVVLRFKSRDGRSVGEFRPDLQVFAVEAAEEDRHALCSVVLAFDPAVSVIVLHVDDLLVDMFGPYFEFPQVGEIWLESDSKGLMISWGEGSSAMARGSYSVQISDDSGRSWWTIAVGLKSPPARLPKESIPTGVRLLIRVQATDGFRAVESVTEWPPAQPRMKDVQK